MRLCLIGPRKWKKESDNENEQEISLAAYPIIDVADG